MAYSVMHEGASNIIKVPTNKLISSSLNQTKIWNIKNGKASITQSTYAITAISENQLFMNETYKESHTLSLWKKEQVGPNYHHVKGEIKGKIVINEKGDPLRSIFITKDLQIVCLYSSRKIAIINFNAKT